MSARIYWAVLLVCAALIGFVSSTKNGEADSSYPPGDPLVLLGVMSSGQLSYPTAAPSNGLFANNVLGLAQLPQTMSCAEKACFGSTLPCTYTAASNYANGCADGICGLCSSPCNVTTRRAAHVVVPAPTTASTASNLAALNLFVDNECDNGKELMANGGCQPFNGMLRGLTAYLSGSYVDPVTSSALTSPLVDAPACKTVHIALLYFPSTLASMCDSDASTESIITQLTSTGITVAGKTFKVRVTLYSYDRGVSDAFETKFVAAGATLVKWATDTALVSSITAAWQLLRVADTCNNVDDDCDGEVDEDYAHYCNVRTDCSVWSTAGQRTTLMTQYLASVSAVNPRGNVSLIPCISQAQGQLSSTWLCHNPGEQCNGVDDNCDGQIDEGFLRCGSPLHCPTAEVCNGLDDDCNGLVDDGVNCGGCVPSVEVCDGCDNDCNGIVDDSPAFSAVSCGVSSPAHCLGTSTCQAPVPVIPGGCVAGRGWGSCSHTPQPELCNDIDDDCNGHIDDNVAPMPCVPEGTPDYVYDGTSQCTRGQQYCGSNSCVGFVGPSTEVCDGVDNDCDGQVDNDVLHLGESCGRCIGQGACVSGTIACESGTVVCKDEIAPQLETNNAVDDNCNALVDDV